MDTKETKMLKKLFGGIPEVHSEKFENKDQEIRNDLEIINECAKSAIGILKYVGLRIEDSNLKSLVDYTEIDMKRVMYRTSKWIDNIKSE